MGIPSERMPAEAPSAHGATVPPPKAGLAPNTSKTVAEMAAVSFGAQLTTANVIFQRTQYPMLSVPTEQPRGCGCVALLKFRLY